jgi:hypothetical protein
VTSHQDVLRDECARLHKAIAERDALLREAVRLLEHASDGPIPSQFGVHGAIVAFLKRARELQ